VAFESIACGDVLLRPIGAGPIDDASAAGVTESGGADGPPSTSPFCEGHGAIPLPGFNQCTSDFARLFRFAACACTSLASSGRLTTDSFDSTRDGGAYAGSTASIGSNDALSTNSRTAVGGSVWVGGDKADAGAPILTLNGEGTIAGDVQVGGDAVIGGAFVVTGNMAAAGNVTTVDAGSLALGGNLTQPAGKVTTGVSFGAGGITNAPVQVAPPCDCANPVDVAAIVTARSTDNDNAAIGFATSALDFPSASANLPCGRYYVDAIRGGGVTIVVTGRCALFVDGDVTIDQALSITLSPAAELDLFVAGSVSIRGSVLLGDPSSPARVRMYVGGPTFDLAATAQIGANVYAPHATMALASSFEMRGALFAQGLAFAGDFTIHYDTSVLQTPGCMPTGGACKTCGDCSGATPACIGGTCAPCSANADCCAPLLCSGGRCGLAPPR
jgi:hypothetical protein